MTGVSVRTMDEIIEQVDQSYVQGDTTTNLTFAEGVRYALDWVTGDSDDPPFELESEESDDSGDDDGN